jgi:DNA-binding response OmpR family regulator
MKILLLEDDVLLQNAIETYLCSTGHQVESFLDGEQAYESIMRVAYDLLVLDINVPSMNGFTLLEKLQENKCQTPTIFISALMDIEDISRAFKLGCHDYLKKPFHLKELTLRINKVLQTRYVPQEHFRLSRSYSYDVKSNILYFKNSVQVLSARQVQIIRLLAMNRSRVVSYDMFRTDVWDDFDLDIGTIRAEINRLKRHLKEDFIINVRSVGYMINRPD